MPWRLASVEEQKEYERQRIEEVKARTLSPEAWEGINRANPGVPYDKPPLDINLSELLEGKDLRALADENGIWKDSYSKLGSGQLRMTIGNVLRGRLKKKLPVIINGEKIGTGS